MILGETLQLQGRSWWYPDVQSRALFLVSFCILSSGCHGVLGLCLVVVSNDTEFWLSGTAFGVAGILTKLFLHA